VSLDRCRNVSTHKSLTGKNMKINTVLAVGSSLVFFIALTGTAKAGGWADVVNSATKAIAKPAPASQGLTSSAQTLQQGTEAVNAAKYLQSDSLTQMLMSKTGVNQNQALTGAGALFKAAQTKMQPDSFLKLQKAIPDMNTMMAAVPASTSKGASSLSSLGALASLAGSSGGSLGSVANVASIFQQSGMSPAMMQKFIPVLVDYAKNSGGADLSGLLRSALLGF
jgi:hypothetical protein